MSSDSIEKLNALIPEFFYDLIGRIAPGAILCLAIAKDAPGGYLPSNPLGAAGLVLLLILLSYVAGFCLDVFSSLTIGRLYRWAVFPALHQLLNKEVYDTDVWQIIRDSTDNEAKAILTKMMAERAMLRNLVALWLGLWIFGSSLLAPLNLLGNAFVFITLVAISFRAEFNCRYEARRI